MLRSRLYAELLVQLDDVSKNWKSMLAEICYPSTTIRSKTAARSSAGGGLSFGRGALLFWGGKQTERFYGDATTDTFP